MKNFDKDFKKLMLLKNNLLVTFKAIFEWEIYIIMYICMVVHNIDATLMVTLFMRGTAKNCESHNKVSKTC